MSIAAIVLRGFGNGTVTGTIPLVITRGYAIGEEALVFTPTGRRSTRGGVFVQATRGGVFVQATRKGGFS